MVESPQFGEDYRTGISEPNPRRDRALDTTISARGLGSEAGAIKRR